VHTPDLFDGALPETIDDGVAHMQALGDEVVDQRLKAALEDLPDALVYAGISFGAAKAQRLAQTRPGAKGALLYESCLPVTGEWAIGPWPAGVPVQVHGMDHDPFFALEGDLDAARELAATVPDLAEVFVYPGDRHLFLDSTLPSYDAVATAEVLRRSLDLLARVG
jgi:dienelactone hydrolase